MRVASSPVVPFGQGRSSDVERGGAEQAARLAVGHRLEPEPHLGRDRFADRHAAAATIPLRL